MMETHSSHAGASAGVPNANGIEAPTAAAREHMKLKQADSVVTG